jgi:hypothetical protein
MKKSELKQIIKEEIVRALVLESNEDIASLVKKHYNDDKFETQKAVRQELGRDLTTLEKGRLTRAWDKINLEIWGKKRDAWEADRKAGFEQRKNKRLLPLKLDNVIGIPDKRYYISNPIVSTTHDGGLYYQAEPSGYTNYKLASSYIDKPITGDIKIGDNYMSLDDVWKTFYRI